MNRLRLILIFSASALSSAAIGQQRAPAEQEGPEIQSEAQDVAGGLEAKPKEFKAEEHLLGDAGGTRKWLADLGISIDPVLSLDYVKNLHGGRDTEGDAWLHALDVYITVKTEPLFDLKGGTLYVDFLTQHGQSPIDEVGDYALVDDIDYGGRTQISEIWYEQKIDEVLRIKLGKIDVNTEFCVARNSLDFSNGGLNSTFPNTQFNFMPTTPDAGFGGVLVFYPSKLCYISAGIFDGALQEGFNGDYGPSTLFGPPDDLYLAFETGCTFNVEGRHPWRIAVGGFHHTGTFADFLGGSQGGNNGFYTLVEAKLWKENPGNKDDGQGLGGFFVYDTADSDVTEIDQHFGGGLAWTGLIEGRDDDVIGAGVSYSHFSGGAGFLDTGELVIEGFYKMASTKYLSVKADLQYIRDPGGAGLNDALAALVRVQVAF
jgi:porin